MTWRRNKHQNRSNWTKLHLYMPKLDPNGGLELEIHHYKVVEVPSKTEPKNFQQYNIFFIEILWKFLFFEHFVVKLLIFSKKNIFKIYRNFQKILKNLPHICLDEISLNLQGISDILIWPGVYGTSLFKIIKSTQFYGLFR